MSIYTDQVKSDVEGYFAGEHLMSQADYDAETDAIAEGEAYADRLAAEYYENRGYEDARAQEVFETQMGIRDPQSGFSL